MTGSTMTNTTIAESGLGSSQQWSFFFDLPTEIQLLVMSKLSLLELQSSKLISQRFKHLANVDQLWRRHALQSTIEDSIMREARECCGVDTYTTAKPNTPTSSPTATTLTTATITTTTTTSTFSWQTLLRTATLIERENRRLIQGNLTQMSQKIHQVREALERQTRVLEETHQKLELLSGRLTQMEQQSRVRELERIRVRRREEARLEDEKWMQEWDALCVSHRLKNASSSSSSSASLSFPQEKRENGLGVSMAGIEEDYYDEEEDDDLFTISRSFKSSCSIDRASGANGTSGTKEVAAGQEKTTKNMLHSDVLEETPLPSIVVGPNGKEPAERRACPGL
ncbi:hypothetical protein BGZ95_003280 [Linnemannia exigua]|uniref:F-box domain-containing protein n=1 Tax=Linnemannia exigua TaxID=604196 RepID=A0AAD4D6I8_9FUNG|nr:hypothetical protein BGZ95_003280 [Linnemannia exigua]